LTREIAAGVTIMANAGRVFISAARRQIRHGFAGLVHALMLELDDARHRRATCCAVSRSPWYAHGSYSP